MTHRNEARIVGRIGRKVKYARAQSGKMYAYFPVECESREMLTTGREMCIIHVSSFNAAVVKYLQGVKAKANDTVVVFGYFSSYATEIKGVHTISNCICATDVYIAKKPKKEREKDKDNQGNNNENENKNENTDE